MCCDKSSEHDWGQKISSTLNHQVLEFTLLILMRVAVWFPPACPVPDMLGTSCNFLLSLLVKQEHLTAQLLPCPACCAVLPCPACCAVLPCPACCAVLPCPACCAVLRCAVLRYAALRCAALRCDATSSDAELGIGGEGGRAGQGQGRQAGPACTGLGPRSSTLLIALFSYTCTQCTVLCAVLLPIWMCLIVNEDKHFF